MPRGRRRDDMARLEAELEAARPFLPLAREISEEVSRVAAGGATADVLAEAIDAIPRRERLELARNIFNQLPAPEQWSIVERVFGDEEIRAALEAARQERLAQARRSAARRPLIARARAGSQVDTREIGAGEELTVGLFREPDVRAALARGHTSTACARRLVLLGLEEPGRFRVIEDVFNPAGGYFVTGHYDEDTWRSRDRLPAHAVVGVGSITRSETGESFTPVLYAGGRADFELDGKWLEGLLHVGYVMVGDDDVFSERGGIP